MGRPPQAPLRALTAAERAALGQLARATSERADRVTRAKLVLAVADGASFTAAAHTVGRRRGDAVARLVARFNREGLAALTPRYGGGAPRADGPAGGGRGPGPVPPAPPREQGGTAPRGPATRPP